MFNPLSDAKTDADHKSTSIELLKKRKSNYAPFLKSIQILNRGITQLKPKDDSSDSFDVTTETYAKLIRGVLDTLNDSKRGELSKILKRTLSEESD